MEFNPLKENSKSANSKGKTNKSVIKAEVPEVAKDEETYSENDYEEFSTFNFYKWASKHSLDSLEALESLYSVPTFEKIDSEGVMVIKFSSPIK